MKPIKRTQNRRTEARQERALERLEAQVAAGQENERVASEIATLKAKLGKI
jgi:hypothetical protein